MQRRHFISALLATLAFASICVPASADGVAFKYRGTDRSYIDLADELGQFGVTLHRNGVQHLVLAVKFDVFGANEPDDAAEAADDRRVWIFPVRARDPAVVTIDLLDQFPICRGSNPRENMRQRIQTVTSLTHATLLCPAIMLPVLGRARGGVSPQFQLGSVLERWGIRAEVIDTNSLESLRDHLAGTGPDVAIESLATLLPYLDSEHCLIACWINSPRQFEEHFGSLPFIESLAPCVYATFPTQEPFFPMRPTSAYGEQQIPLDLVVFDHVDLANVNSAISNRLRVEHFEINARKLNLPAGMMDALGTFSSATSIDGPLIRYTRIRGSAPANEFTTDLEFIPEMIRTWAFASRLDRLLAEHEWLEITLAVLVVLITSYLAAGLSGLIAYRKWRGHAWIGVFNLGSILAVILVIYLRERWRRHSGPVRAEWDTSPQPERDVAVPYHEMKSFRWYPDPSGRMRLEREAPHTLFLLVFAIAMVFIPFIMWAILAWPFT